MYTKGGPLDTTTEYNKQYIKKKTDSCHVPLLDNTKGQELGYEFSETDDTGHRWYSRHWSQVILKTLVTGGTQDTGHRWYSRHWSQVILNTGHRWYSRHRSQVVLKTLVTGGTQHRSQVVLKTLVTGGPEYRSQVVLVEQDSVCSHGGRQVPAECE